MKPSATTLIAILFVSQFSSQLRAQQEPGKLESLKALLATKVAEADKTRVDARLKLHFHYEGRLETILAERMDAGDLEGAVAVKEAMQNPAQPFDPARKVPASLAAAKRVLDETIAKLDAEYDSQVRGLQTSYLARLRSYEDECTRLGDLAGARAIREEIGRYPANLLAGYEQGGGKNDAQVRRALDWLTAQQNKDGSWGTSYPIAMTSFAILAYSGHGERVDSPKYGASLLKAINYVIEHGRRNNGLLAKPGAHASYEHGIATYALADAYPPDGHDHPDLKPVSVALRNAVPIIIEGQTKGGGWLYAYSQNGIGDLSVSAWNIQALRAAKLTGRTFTGLDQAMAKGREFISATSAPNGLYRYRVSDKDLGRLSLTGAGVVCARLLGKAQANEDQSLAAILATKPRQFRTLDPYALYYHSQACFLKGGETWENYRQSYQALIADSQEPDGSWPVAAGHVGALQGDAKLYHTCLFTLMLEVDFRAARWGDEN